jgi:hypothetical protein
VETDMRNLTHWSSELTGNLRLVAIAFIGMVAAFAFFLRTAEGSWREHLLHAALVGLAPLVIAFPRLFRQRA